MRDRAVVRPVDALRELLEDDPYKAFRPATGSKRIVTFLREKPKAKLELPMEMDGARILLMKGSEIFRGIHPPFDLRVPSMTS